MAHNLDDLKEYLVGLGTDEVSHTGSVFMSHLTGVYDYLKRWGRPEHVVVAGMFHSIYGTEAFHGFSLPLARRGELRRLIGQQAERLAYVFSAVTWPSFQASVMTGNVRHLRDRFTGSAIVVTKQEFEDLLWVHLANVLEQEDRLGERMRRGRADRARLWQIVSEKLGRQAVASWAEVYDAAESRRPSDFAEQLQTN